LACSFLFPATSTVGVFSGRQQLGFLHRGSQRNQIDHRPDEKELGSLLDDPELTAYAHLARPAAPTPAMTSPATAAGNGDAEIKSPMIGTFYRTPSPDAAPYVEVGSEVGPDTVVCIIEAMKVMNEIKAETRGIITALVAENAKPVEFGQPLFKIRPL
jgi:acetyl-CoA carboxylase biotin carboxyl carrier protein